MIKYHSIKFKNFLSYGNSITEFDFETGVTRLSGKTGEGKSTVVEALYYNLFGKPYRNINLSQLINNINKKEMETYLHFSTSDGTEYWIDRGIKPNFFRVYKNTHDENGIIPLDSKTKTYQEMLEEDILKFNSNIFNQNTYKSLTKDSAFLKLPAKDKRAIVDEILDSKVYFQMNAIAKIKIDNLTKEIASLEKEIKHHEVLIEQEQNNIDNLEKIKAQQEQLSKTRIDEINKQIKKLEEDIQTNIKAINKLDKYKTKKLSIEESIADKDSILTVMLNKRDDDLLNLNKESQKKQKDINSKYETVLQEKQKTANEDIDKCYKQKVSSQETVIKAEEAERESLTAKLNEVSSRISLIKNKVKFLKESCGDCPNISKMIETENVEELLETKHKLTEIIAKKKEEAVNKTSEYEEVFKERHKSIKDDLQNYTNKLKEEKEKLLEEVEVWYQNEVKRTQLEVNDKLVSIRAEIESLKPELNKCNEIIGMEVGLKTQIDSYKSMIDSLTKEIKTISENKIEIDYTNKDNYILQKEVLCKEYDTLSNDKKHYSYARTLLSDENIKAFVVKKYLPSINKLLNKNLQLFTDGIVMDFDEEFEPVFKARHKETYTYESHSEGQKRLINIAILFMMIEFCSIKYQNATSNILILDEVTVGLDVELQNDFYSVLKRMAKDTNKNIIVMQHGDISTENIDRLYKIEMVNGFSKLNLTEL